MRRGPYIINTCSGTSSWQSGFNNDFYRPGCFANTRRSRKKTKMLLVPIRRLAGESLSFFDAEAIATGISNTSSKMVVPLEGLHQVCLSLHAIPLTLTVLHELCTIRPDTVQPRRRRGNQRPRIPTSFTNSQLFTYV